MKSNIVYKKEKIRKQNKGVNLTANSSAIFQVQYFASTLMACNGLCPEMFAAGYPCR